MDDFKQLMTISGSSQPRQVQPNPQCVFSYKDIMSQLSLQAISTDQLADELDCRLHNEKSDKNMRNIRTQDLMAELMNRALHMGMILARAQATLELGESMGLISSHSTLLPIDLEYE